MYKKTLFLLFLVFSPLCQAEYKYRLSICAIFQDEAPYLKEWIEFHKLVGVEHFYLHNHRSKDDYKKILEPYIAAGLVDLTEKPKVAHPVKIFNRLQCASYSECLEKAKGVSQWVAFIDIDEYLFPMKEQTLVKVLEDFQEFGGICVNWRMYGTSHVKKLAHDQLLIEQLTRCSPQSFPGNRYIKSIVKPEYASTFKNPHHPVFDKGKIQVNTDKIPFEGPFFSPYIQTNKLRINHYWTRDEEYLFEKKIPRQKKWGAKPNPQEIQQGLNAEKDESILRFAPQLRKAMGLGVVH